MYTVSQMVNRIIVVLVAKLLPHLFFNSLFILCDKLKFKFKYSGILSVFMINFVDLCKILHLLKLFSMNSYI
jgi:hypothetical protein